MYISASLGISFSAEISCCSYVNTMKQFLKLLFSVQYFTCRDWKIDNTNTKELMSKLNAADKKVLRLDVIVLVLKLLLVFSFNRNYIQDGTGRLVEAGVQRQVLIHASECWGHVKSIWQDTHWV